MKKLSSLTIFFPFFNDQGTVEEAVRTAYLVGNKVTDDLEVIAIHGGESKDKTFAEIWKMKKKYPSLKVLDQTNNQIGYAVIKHGLAAASKEWIFYTDGDLQYDLNQLSTLIQAQQVTHAEVVNGYKTTRSDPFDRQLLGKVYQIISQKIFQFPIRDIDCDFRLLKKSALHSIKLESTHASILPELIYKLHFNGVKFAEVPVSHFPRKYGASNYSSWQLSWEKVRGDWQLFWKLKKSTQNPGKNHS